MPPIQFIHPQITDSLVINTGANQVSWSYGLNTQTTPTYGGDVVQILSAYIDDITITGDARDYQALEKIYKWFLQYFLIASQGGGGQDVTYTEQPITMHYPERGWTLMIQPKALPGFRYARDLVAPQYNLVAQVVEDDPQMAALTLQAAKLGDFQNLTADIGFDPDNPFSNPFPHKGEFARTETRQSFKEISDYFHSLIPAWTSGDFSSLTASGPTGFLNPDRQGFTQDATK